MKRRGSTAKKSKVDSSAGDGQSTSASTAALAQALSFQSYLRKVERISASTERHPLISSDSSDDEIDTTPSRKVATATTPETVTPASPSSTVRVRSPLISSSSDDEDVTKTNVTTAPGSTVCVTVTTPACTSSTQLRLPPGQRVAGFTWTSLAGVLRNEPIRVNLADLQPPQPAATATQPENSQSEKSATARGGSGNRL